MSASRSFSSHSFQFLSCTRPRASGLAMTLIAALTAWLGAPARADGFSVTSASYQEGKKVPDENVFSGFGCTGKNASPDIKWKNAPKETKSFAITIFDPDAPTGSGWWHWTIFNIPATAASLAKGASGDATKLPKGSIEGRTDFGKPGYGGPCPPSGDKAHHYILTVYALKVPHIDLTQDSPGAMVGFYVNQNMLAKAQITSIYNR